MRRRELITLLGGTAGGGAGAAAGAILHCASPQPFVEVAAAGRRTGCLETRNVTIESWGRHA
jgi:hypothetical protein